MISQVSGKEEKGKKALSEFDRVSKAAKDVVGKPLPLTKADAKGRKEKFAEINKAMDHLIGDLVDIRKMDKVKKFKEAGAAAAGVPLPEKPAGVDKLARAKKYNKLGIRPAYDSMMKDVNAMGSANDLKKAGAVASTVPSPEKPTAPSAGMMATRWEGVKGARNEFREMRKEIETMRAKDPGLKVLSTVPLKPDSATTNATEVVPLKGHEHDRQTMDPNRLGQEIFRQHGTEIEKQQREFKAWFDNAKKDRLLVKPLNAGELSSDYAPPDETDKALMLKHYINNEPTDAELGINPKLAEFLRTRIDRRDYTGTKIIEELTANAKELFPTDPAERLKAEQAVTRVLKTRFNTTDIIKQEQEEESLLNPPYAEMKAREQVIHLETNAGNATNQHKAAAMAAYQKTQEASNQALALLEDKLAKLVKAGNQADAKKLAEFLDAYRNEMARRIGGTKKRRS